MYKCKDNVIITIGRTFGSGGREIGKKVALELGIPFYDKELLEVQAKECGGAYFREELQAFDEKKPSVFLNLMAYNSYVGDGKASLDMLAQDIQIRAIKSVANNGSCVIVGRCADKILKSEYDILRVFISAPIEKRIERVSRRERISENDSRKEILKADKVRRSYYNAFGEGDWGDASNYDLCINSGDLGTINSAAMIIHYLKLKGKIERANINKTDGRML